MSNQQAAPIAFSVLENNIDFAPRQNTDNDFKPSWLSQYDKGSFLKPFGERNPVPDDVGGHQIYKQQGDDLQLTMPPMYNKNVEQNYELQRKLQEYGLPSQPGAVLPQPLHIPQFKPPYGTPYPSSGYSAYDAELVRAAGIPMAIARPPLPAASPPALMNVEPNVAVPMGYGNQVRERYKDSFTCMESIHHAINCPFCKSYLQNKERLLWVVIAILVVLCLLLTFLCLRRK